MSSSPSSREESDPLGGDDDLDSAFPAPSPAPRASGDGASPLAGAPTVGAEARREQRVKVVWPGRIQLPNGQVMNGKVRDISESGVGLAMPSSVPHGAILPFAMGTPGLEDPKAILAISGTIKVVYVVLQHGDFQVGAVWQQISDLHRDIVGRWLRRLRRT